MILDWFHKVKEFGIIDFLLHKSKVHVVRPSHLHRADDAKINKCTISVLGHSSLMIGKGAVLENVFIYIRNGELCIDNDVIIKGTPSEKVSIIVDEGTAVIHDHSVITCNRLWVRYGGHMEIGAYTNINSKSEVRCDEAVHIGDYCQISYQVRIWDTNTHHVYDSDTRRANARNHYPDIGYDRTKPVTSPVHIGNECWLGEKSAVLKGTEIGDCSIIGFNTMVVGRSIPAHSTVVTDLHLKVIDRTRQE